MQSIPLFVNKKEIFVFLGAVVCVALISLGVTFYNYKKFTDESLHVSKATVLNHYQKTNERGRTYDVFKLRLDTSNIEVYTTSWRPVNAEVKSRVKVKLKVNNVGFIDYLRGFYAPNLALYSIYEDHPPWDMRGLYRWIERQHSDETTAELYKTLLFATPVSKTLRDDVQKWGISHLIAISGYNVGVISFLLFVFLRPIYRFFQDRYFPYRNATADISFVIFVVLFIYMIAIDFIPSFLRAFVMSLLGFFFYSRGIKVLSFENLGLTVALLLAFFPELFFSLSFWFSVAGVFYLFLFLHHFGQLSKWLLLLGTDLGIFFLMLPIVHTFFPVFTFLQLSTPLTSLLFIGFYPLGFFLHVIGYGNLLDAYLLEFLAVPTQVYTLHFPVWFLSLYVILSLLAIRWRFLVFICLGTSIASLFLIQ